MAYAVCVTVKVTPEELRNYLADIAPEGDFWTGPAMDLFIDAITGAADPLVQFTSTVGDQAWPFLTNDISVLSEWLAYLQRVSCVPPPTDLEAIRTLVLSILGAPNSALSLGLDQVVRSYLPLVELADDLPATWLPVQLDAKLDGRPKTVEIWLSLLHDSPNIARCVAQAFVPGCAGIRIVTPLVTVANPSASSLAGDTAFHWRHQRTKTKLDLVLDGGADSATLLDIPSEDVRIVSDMLPATGPGDNITGQVLDYTFTRSWADGTRIVVVDSFTFP